MAESLFMEFKMKILFLANIQATNASAAWNKDVSSHLLHTMIHKNHYFAISI